MTNDMFTLQQQEYSPADAEWDDFVATHPHGSFLQTTAWATLKNPFGWTSRRVWLRQDDRIVAGAQIMFRSAAFGIAKIAYIPHGPLVDWDNHDQLTVLLNEIDQAVYEHRASLLKIEPLLWQNDFPSDRWHQICQTHNLIPDTDTIQPPRTMLIDLTPPLDDIMKSFKQKTRYNIRLAGRKDVTTRIGTRADIPAFNKLIQSTGDRNEFGVHTPKYYENAFDLFMPDNGALILAEYDNTPLAAIMVMTHANHAYYLYGASSNEERQRMPTYAVQWAAIEWAKERGCTHYDLWGLPDADPDTLEDQFQDRNDGLWGVYRFKRGFQGDIRRTVACADRSYNPLFYRLYQWWRNRS
ncbi:MAG TPA: peptidoglycan bridge formation glycyltransferase FemA/FemB family protein [Anaerolineae bacterium]|nr:peptidoglycan bridge formation glycyltransferase FemA/FemB family protein [Anaerolineae bacterium]